jgi:hypothetical protein
MRSKLARGNGSRVDQMATGLDGRSRISNQLSVRSKEGTDGHYIDIFANTQIPKSPKYTHMRYRKWCTMIKGLDID